MLRMTDNNNSSNAVGATVTSGENEFISIDQKKRQITFIEPSVVGVGTGAAATAAAGVVVPPTAGAIEGQNANEAVAGSSAVPLDRAPMVSAPKIFAFDGLFTNVDPQVSKFSTGNFGTQNYLWVPYFSGSRIDN